MEAEENNEIIYEFGGFALDPRERVLLSGGKPVHLRAKEFETLLLFLENNGKAISKEQMMSALWQGAFVEEGSLVKQISRLRKIFNDDGTVFIETLPKHGYRFSAEVDRVDRSGGERILKKRTGEPPGGGFENQTKGPRLPSAANSPEGIGYRSVYIYVALVLFAVLLVGFVWFLQNQNRTASSKETGIIFLTDGSRDDSGGRLTSGGQIRFSRKISNTRIESWTMNADGGEARRANDQIKDLLHGVWSPDGKKVVFTKEGDKNVYLADSNGSNEILLPIAGGNMDWSPDGSQFVHQAKVAHDKNEIFLYTLATGENVKLIDDAAADPSFSYDGKQIAFTSWRDGNPEIYLVNTDGSNARRLTDHPAFDQYPVFTPDGTAIAFQSNREDERIEVFLQNINVDAPPKRITNSNSYTGLSAKSWSADGTRILLYTNQHGNNRIFWADADPGLPKRVLSDESADINFPRLDPTGRRVLYQARQGDGGIELRLTELDLKRTETIFRTGPNYPQGYSLAPAFSPDANRIAFNDRVTGNSEIYVINKDGSGLQKLTHETSTDTNPIFAPDGREIIFTRDFYGKSRLYRINLDDGGQHNMMEMAGFEINGGFSPDGTALAFAADRQTADSRGLDIYLLDYYSPKNEVRLTAGHSHDVAPAFSPDGTRIVFASNSDGNWEIYVINRDGTGLCRLTRNVADDTSPQWSWDGTRILFSSKREGKSAIYEVPL